MRELTGGEIRILEECLKELADHHNRVSVNFKGAFPKKPFEETLASFRRDIESGKSRIAAGPEGAVDYLIVLKEARGKGYGDLLMGWALDALRHSGVSRIEVKVVDGNEAAGFYEKYGFRICSHILRMNV